MPNETASKRNRKTTPDSSAPNTDDEPGMAPRENKSTKRVRHGPSPVTPAHVPDLLRDTPPPSSQVQPTEDPPMKRSRTKSYKAQYMTSVYEEGSENDELVDSSADIYTPPHNRNKARKTVTESINPPRSLKFLEMRSPTEVFTKESSSYNALEATPTAEFDYPTDNMWKIRQPRFNSRAPTSPAQAQQNLRSPFERQVNPEPKMTGNHQDVGQKIAALQEQIKALVEMQKLGASGVADGVVAPATSSVGEGMASPGSSSSSWRRRTPTPSSPVDDAAIEKKVDEQYDRRETVVNASIRKIAIPAKQRCILLASKETAPPRYREFWNMSAAASPPLRMVQLRSIQSAAAMGAVGPFGQLGVFDPHMCKLDDEGRFRWQDDDRQGSPNGHVMGVMIGVVSRCNIVVPMKYTPRGAETQFHKRLVITPAYDSFKAFQYFLHKVAGKQRLKAQIENGSDLIFTTRKGSKSSGKKRVQPRDQKGLYAAASDDEDLPAVWYMRGFPAFLEYDDPLPIYDASTLGFRFDEASFKGLPSLPLYRGDRATGEESDLQQGDVVAVLYTGNIFSIQERDDVPRMPGHGGKASHRRNTSSNGGEDWLSLNCHAVMYLAPAADSSAEGTEAATNT
ncbi:hypothetical protein BJ165DRAFT_1535481 [Panaeolus papilionaceus]|nr:hypothetical protein BJ165DRAFT_1535481 [Panaeolus papilionaceus]